MTWLSSWGSGHQYRRRAIEAEFAAQFIAAIIAMTSHQSNPIGLELSQFNSHQRASANHSPVGD
jgi:hypothetical protein